MSDAPALLSVNRLTKSYGGVHAVRGVSFVLRSGEILALIGPNGAGKSTCFDMLNGQRIPDSGRIMLLGEETTGRAPRAVWRLGRTHVPDHRDVCDHDRARERAGRIGLALRTAVRSLVLDAEAGAGRGGRVLELVGMSGYADRPCGELAYGDLKRLELAVALANEPKLLLMDEPTAGMAPRERIDLMRMTARMAREKSIGVLFTEHDWTSCSSMPTVSWC